MIVTTTTAVESGQLYLFMHFYFTVKISIVNCASTFANMDCVKKYIYFSGYCFILFIYCYYLFVYLFMPSVL